MNISKTTRKTSCFTLALAAAMILPSAAWAASGTAVKFSPPLYPSYGNDLECAVTNVSVSALNVTIDVIGYAGYPVFKDGRTLDSLSVTVAPLNTQRLTVTSDNTLLPIFCRFRIEGGANTVRASACAKDSMSPHACVAAQ